MTLAEQLAARQEAMATLRGDVLQKAALSPKVYATFEPAVLEHLRQSNLAAYEVTLRDIKADIQAVLQRG